jgi:hypothetical protein
MFEQIRMGAGTVKGNGMGRKVYLVAQKPVVFDMTFPFSFPLLAMQKVGAASFGKGLLVHDEFHDVS